MSIKFSIVPVNKSKQNVNKLYMTICKDYLCNSISDDSENIEDLNDTFENESLSENEVTKEVAETYQVPMEESFDLIM